MPGGGLDFGEPLNDCLRRELREETDGLTDLVAWHRMDELENLPRVSLVDAGVAALNL